MAGYGAHGHPFVEPRPAVTARLEEGNAARRARMAETTSRREHRRLSVEELSGTREMTVPLLTEFTDDIVGNEVTFNAIGVLEIGHPVAIEYNGERVYPAGPARAPNR